VATNSSSSIKTGKRSTSKRKSSDSNGKKTVPTSAQAKRKEVDINYYEIDFNGDAKFKEKYETLFRRELLLLSIVHMFPNPSSGESSITFRLFNEDHTWTLEKFNEALRIPIGGSRVTPQHWNEKELWRTISVELDYDSKRSSVTSIRHPALRYVFKVFSNTNFGRQEGTPLPPYDGNPSSPSPTTSSCASLRNSIDEIMANQTVITTDQKVIKDELASISAILTSLGPWLQS
ncbi:ADP-ribosylation factor-like protein 4D, partial [Bienertia sinuspersici]